MNVFLKLRLWLSLVGMTCVVVGSKYLNTGLSKNIVTGAGVSLLALGSLAALQLHRKASAAGCEGEGRSWLYAFCWQSQWLLCAGIYFCYAFSLGQTGAPEGFVQKLLLAGWVVWAVTGSFMGFGVETSMAQSGLGEFSEPGRIRRSMIGWLRAGLVGLCVAALQFTAVRKNQSWDLSYLKTSKVSDSTSAAIDTLSVPVEVTLFFPAGNEVLNQIRPYFDSLRSAKNVTVTQADVEMDPVVAEQWKTGRNGVIALKSSGGMERIETGLTLTSARKTLKNFDGEFQRALLSSTQKKKTLYFTRGHGELDWDGGDDVNSLQSIRILNGVLRGMNYTQKFFGISEGSVREVPADADAVVVVGSKQDFLKEEVSALEKYTGAGGRLLVLLDVDRQNDLAVANASRDISKDPLVQWLSKAGISFETGVLANESAYVAATRSPADHWFLGTNVFTSHESVATLARQDQKANVLTFRSGWLKTVKVSGKWNIYDTVRSLSDTFVDENRNFKFDSVKENRGARVIGAVSISDENAGATAGRISVFADASAVSDALVRNQANLIYFVDSLKWLTGDAKIAGIPASEEDVRIRHTSREDIFWFYGTVVVVPLLVVACGALIRRSQRRRSA